MTDDTTRTAPGVAVVEVSYEEYPTNWDTAGTILLARTDPPAWVDLRLPDGRIIRYGATGGDTWGP